MKTKITEEGQECRHCGSKVVKMKHTKPPKFKAGGYYFEWWFRCPRCRALYMVETAKRYFGLTQQPLFAGRFIARSAGQTAVETAMGNRLAAKSPEPFQHGPDADAHGDDLIPPWIPYEERAAWLAENYPGEHL